VYFERPIAGLIVAGLAATFLLGPALVAVLSLIFMGQPGGPRVQPIVPVPFAPVLESGRVLLTLVLAFKVLRTTELE
jgi:hypothetical protein